MYCVFSKPCVRVSGRGLRETWRQWRRVSSRSGRRDAGASQGWIYAPGREHRAPEGRVGRVPLHPHKISGPARTGRNGEQGHIRCPPLRGEQSISALPQWSDIDLLGNGERRLPWGRLYLTADPPLGIERKLCGYQQTQQGDTIMKTSLVTKSDIIAGLVPIVGTVFSAVALATATLV